MSPHTLAHALHPGDTNCRHSMANIHTCVICGKPLPAERNHIDTHNGACYNMLLTHQRAVGC